MEVEAYIVTINGTDYITRQDAERLLTEADERRRLHMQERIDLLERGSREAVLEIARQRGTIRALEEVRRIHSRHSD